MLWLIVVYGAAVIVAFSSVGQPIVGDVVEALVVSVGIVFALAGLSGIGPLRERTTTLRPSTEPEPEPDSGQRGKSNPVDQMVRLSERWWAGDISDADFNDEKRRILSL